MLPVPTTFLTCINTHKEHGLAQKRTLSLGRLWQTESAVGLKFIHKINAFAYKSADGLGCFCELIGRKEG